MTEKELILQLQSLKEIKPRKDWAFSVKMQVLGLDKATPAPVATPASRGIISRVFEVLSYGKLAYVLAAFVFVVTGMFGFAQYTLPGDMLFSVKKITEQSQATIVGESQVKNNVEILKKRTQDLAQVVKERKDANKSAAVKEVADAAKTLTDAVVKDPSVAKDIALELKNNETLASLQDSADADAKTTIQEMYKTVLDPLINDEKNMSLNEEQQLVLQEVLNLYDKKDYFAAFEKNFDLNISVDSSQTAN